MTEPVLSSTLLSLLHDIERRLVALERAPQLTSAGIRDGALTIYDAAGVARVRIGKDGSDYGVKVYDAAGANAVSLAALAFGAESADVLTFETGTSTGWADLATAGPAVTVNIGASGRALVICTAQTHILTSGGVQMSFAVSGATTQAPDDSRKLRFSNDAASNSRLSALTLVTGLTPGDNTFTAKYAVDSVPAGNGFSYRNITVLPY